MKQTQLDSDYKDRTQQMTVTLYTSLAQCIANVILELRNLEVENKVYKKLPVSAGLHDCYQPLVHEVEEAIRKQGVKSFSMFGHLCKFRPHADARNFLKSMGYFILRTMPPHLYVLDDYVRAEQQSLVSR